MAIERGSVIRFADGKVGIAQARAWGNEIQGRTVDYWDVILRDDMGLVRRQIADHPSLAVEAPRTFAVGQRVTIGGTRISGIIAAVHADSHYTVERTSTLRSGISTMQRYRVPNWLLDL